MRALPLLQIGLNGYVIHTVTLLQFLSYQTKNKSLYTSWYRGFLLLHDSDRIRTCDQVIKSHLLCQLSYGA